MRNLGIARSLTYSHAVPHGRVLLSAGSWTRSCTFGRSDIFRSSLIANKTLQKISRKSKEGICRSGLLEDTPFVVAISVSILSSLILKRNEEEEGTEDDVRNGAVTIISFIPLFNWLGWVFVWLDTNDYRYLVYALVYLAPYIRTGLSFSTSENWLLILSYVACIYHVQLEFNTQVDGLEMGNNFLQDQFRFLKQKESASSSSKEKFTDVSQTQNLQSGRTLSDEKNEDKLNEDPSKSDENEG
ncbi:hypothetical protein KP509_09G085400 [Ceratopteris richardii]|uniref:Uncharacterized protein n=1 Tax=Ceratopteris richardii TaxID=49495 RepID=A0A8T2UCE0_CERRI|nr:hypothetical protein KP509_09G085400 [Ceratopteris richardii]